MVSKLTNSNLPILTMFVIILASDLYILESTFLFEGILMHSYMTKTNGKPMSKTNRKEKEKTNYLKIGKFIDY